MESGRSLSAATLEKAPTVLEALQNGANSMNGQ